MSETPAQPAGEAEPGSPGRLAIWGTPAAVRRLLAAGWDEVEPAAEAVAQAHRTLLVGTGRSVHVAGCVEPLLRAVGTEAWAVPAFEFARYPRPLRHTDAVVIFSHTGVTRSAAEAITAALTEGIRPIVVTPRGTGLPAGLDALVIHTVERERSALETVSLLGALTVVARVAVRVGELDGLVSLAAPIRAALPRLPDALDAMLARSEAVARIAAESEARGGRYCFVGAGPNRATGPEHALTVREGSDATAEGLEIESFSHGPPVGLTPNDLVTVIAPPGPALARAEELLRALAHLGCPTWLQGGPADAPATYHDPLPELPEVLTPLPALILGQLLAYHLACRRGTGADPFHTDDPRFQAAVRALRL